MNTDPVSFCLLSSKCQTMIIITMSVMLKHCLHNNVHKKQLSWPRLILHRPPVQNIIGHIRWWLETIFIKNNFAFFWYYHRFSTGVIDFVGIHYSDAVMSMMASQITNHAVVYSTVYSGADQRKHQNPRHWPLWGEFTGYRWIPRTKGQ